MKKKIKTMKVRRKKKMREHALDVEVQNSLSRAAWLHKTKNETIKMVEIAVV